MAYSVGPGFKSQYCKKEEESPSWVLVVHTCNPSYLEGQDQEDHSSRPAQANTSLDPIFEITRTKGTKGMAQALDHLLCKHKTLSSNPSTTKKRGGGESPDPTQNKAKQGLWSKATEPVRKPPAIWKEPARPPIGEK
jgi:hypothetical protein